MASLCFFIILLFSSLCVAVVAPNHDYSLVPQEAKYDQESAWPIPVLPGGRMAVHGWLILPFDQQEPHNFTKEPVGAWFVHHTPEFFPDSPHNFQIILQGEMTPVACAENEIYAIPIPYPPVDDLLVDEFTITPPPSFSLDDLLLGKISSLLGVVYNGSFDTLYERIPLSIATLDIKDLTTAVWLNYSTPASDNFAQLQYYSYPRSTDLITNGTIHLYLSHQIYAPPDFDQVIHATLDLDECQCQGCGDDLELDKMVQIPGVIWAFDDIPNELASRLMPNATPVTASLLTLEAHIKSVTCPVVVLEEIHCVVGPDFFSRCPSDLKYL